MDGFLRKNDMDKIEQQIHELQQTISRLQSRVNYLQNLLSQAGISYDASESGKEEGNHDDSYQENRTARSSVIGTI